MALPKQVQKQIDESKRIETELRAAEATPAEPAPVEPAPAEPVVAAPAPVVESTPASQPTPQPQPDAQYAELLQQYRSLQGIHRTLTRTNSELKEQVQNQNDAIGGLQQEVIALRQQMAAPAPVIPVITDDEVREFGPDLISVIERKANAVAAPLKEQLALTQTEVQRLTQRNAELEQMASGLARDQAETSQERFATRLSQLVPDFQRLNFDQNFLGWLARLDPLDPHKRTMQERLNEAVQLGDADAVAGFFNVYRQIAQRQTPAPVAAPNPTLVAQAQPASRSAPDNTPPTTAKTWSQAEIAAFYDGVTRGRYSPADKMRIERDIYSAQRDGRIAA